ncbi:H-2 class II histocompatibility antigen, E-S beta chain-like isoform X4 [Simochromis diagramma]|uniref:H-2 class II histocompatibility antigen, E-S beta chain-like isoform X4 n=1 Tax=Simochromis diagramma TaxID=43689 RepID=UPI001A7E8D47|nr:H-2 class II histocompatibility antigen, E-S beta chain-like isoform X4 [Simochromis diagramma]
MASSFLCLSLLFISLSTAGGFMYYDLNRCVFNSTEVKDIEYVRSWYCNKVEFIRFDSSVGKFVGYTELGVKNAERLNKDQGQLAAYKAQKETYCTHNIGIWYSNILSKSGAPTVKLHSMTPVSSHHPAMLVCSIYDFYPSEIKVSWLRDGQEVTSDVTSTEEMADGDWYYQTHSHLEYTPRSGEKISCVVEHASLKEPLKTDWDPSSDPSMPESERNKLAIGASGLILGLILSLAGFIYYKRKARGRILVPTN